MSTVTQQPVFIIEVDTKKRFQQQRADFDVDSSTANHVNLILRQTSPHFNRALEEETSPRFNRTRRVKANDAIFAERARRPGKGKRR